MPSLVPAAEDAARQRLGPAEADAFLARLEILSQDIREPLAPTARTSPRRTCSCRRSAP